jgi:DNA-binding NtrC family response regulator
MPVMNGVQTFKEIKKDHPDTTVIMMTAFSLDDLIKNALKEGAYGVMRKPLDIEKVVKTIEAAKEESTLVMVIDDDINTRETLKDVLTEKGFNVTAAKSGEEAIEIAKTKPHHIILVDVKLPLLNGLETYSAIRNVNPKVKAIFMTAHREETKELVKQALERSAYACLYKPFDVEDAVELIKEVYKAKK